MDVSILHRRAVRHFRAGNAQRWVACLSARRIVGNYSEGETVALADELCLSISQVHNLADAGRAYVAYRKVSSHVPTLRKRLTTSHFAVACQLQGKYGFDDFQALGYLVEAAEDSESVAAWRDRIDKIYSTKPTAFKTEGKVDEVFYRDGGTVIVVFCRDCSDAPEIGSAVRIVQRTSGQVVSNVKVDSTRLDAN